MPKRAERIWLGLALGALVILVAILVIPAMNSTPNDGKTGEYMVYKVLEDGETRDGDWRIEVHELPTPLKAKTEELVISTEDRDFLLYGDVLTLQEGVVVDVEYREVTDAPGGEKRKDVMTPYSKRIPGEG